MNRLMMGCIALVIGLANVMAEPQRIEDPKTEQSCEKAENAGEPHCKPERTRRQQAAPTRRDDVTVPPDIPAEGLPHQDGQPSTGNSPDKPQP